MKLWDIIFNTGFKKHLQFIFFNNMQKILRKSVFIQNISSISKQARNQLGFSNIIFY